MGRGAPSRLAQQCHASCGSVPSTLSMVAVTGCVARCAVWVGCPVSASHSASMNAAAVVESDKPESQVPLYLFLNPLTASTTRRGQAGCSTKLGTACCMGPLPFHEPSCPCAVGMLSDRGLAMCSSAYVY